MLKALLIAPLLLAAAQAEPDLPEFEPAALRFADAAGCRGHLDGLVADARRDGYDAAEGPYELEPSDVRAHTVRAEGSGHRIFEYRCAAERLSTRSWSRSMAPAEEEFTVESVARRAPWLEQGRRQQH